MRVLYEKTAHSLGRSGIDLYYSIFMILMYRMGTICLNFVCDFLFEAYIAPYGCVVSSIALKNMFYSGKLANNSAVGSAVEYYVFEGSKSLAKISRIPILSGISKIVHLFFDFYLVYDKDKTKWKWVFWAFFVGAFILSLVRLAFAKRSFKKLREANEINYFREKHYAESMDMSHVVKAYNGEENAVEKYKIKSKHWEHAWLRYKYSIGFQALAYDLMTKSFRMAFVAAYVIANPSITGFETGTLVISSYEIIRTFSIIFLQYKEIMESVELADYIVEKLEEEPEALKKEKIRVDMFNEAIEVTDLTYIARGRVIFSNVSMVLRKGEKVALYGRNGIGKSSIFKVLMNFDEFSGQVKLDGTDIRNFLMTDYRKLITYVPQDTKLFDDTVYGNLVFGSDCSYEEVMTECKKMKIHDKIVLLPNGYNTVVGEGGKNLNGGLRQKIFYTRAFLRNTPIYLFDEPTNNLDEANAQFLLDYINDPKYADKTFLVICHDMGIVEQFPKIYKFAEGDIVLEKE